MTSTPDETADVAIQQRREQLVAPQLDEFSRMNELHAVNRGVNTVLVSATSREEMAESICEELANSALYRTVCMADRPTWTGNADRWTVASVLGDEGPTPPTLGDDAFDRVASTAAESASTLLSVDAAQMDGWTVVPVTYDRTVYGAIGLVSSCPPVGDHEREVLSELGRVIGHAINAVETRRLLADAAVTELELRNSDATNPLVEAAGRSGCRFELEGLVPATENGSVVYLHIENATAEAASKSLAAVSDDDVQPIRENEDGDGGLLAWTIGGDSLLGLLVDHGAKVTEAIADHDAATYIVEMASDADVRTLLERAQQVFPETWLDAKRELERPIEPANGISGRGIERLTDRQCEVLEAAYHAGYFRWPRDSTAEEIAETLNISAPTLHAHLRKAEQQLLGELFDSGSRRRQEHSAPHRPSAES